MVTTAWHGRPQSTRLIGRKPDLRFFSLSGTSEDQVVSGLLNEKSKQSFRASPTHFESFRVIDGWVPRRMPSWAVGKLKTFRVPFGLALSDTMTPNC